MCVVRASSQCRTTLVAAPRLLSDSNCYFLFAVSRRYWAGLVRPLLLLFRAHSSILASLFRVQDVKRKGELSQALAVRALGDFARAAGVSTDKRRLEAVVRDVSGKSGKVRAVLFVDFALSVAVWWSLMSPRPAPSPALDAGVKARL